MRGEWLQQTSVMLRSSRMRVSVSCNLTLQAAAGCSFCDRTPEVVELSQIIRACLLRVSPTSLMSPPPPSCLPHLPHVSPTSLMSPLPPSCHPQPDPNAKPNHNPVQTGLPKFVKSVKNGKLYTVGEGDDLVHLVHVWGEGAW